MLEAPAPEGTLVRLTAPSETSPPWAGLHRMVAEGGTVPGLAGGRLVGRPGPGPMPARAPEARASVRRSPGDQSHTSVVIDERSVLKLYRRLVVGQNVEAEVLEALARVTSAPVPAWHGSVQLELAGGESTAVAIEQDFVAGAVDAFEALADDIAAWLAGDRERDGVPTAIPRATGLAAGRLHAALASVASPSFGERAALHEERAASLRTAVASIDVGITSVAVVDPGVAVWLRASALAIAEALGPLADPTLPIRLQRIHGDLHLGQVLPVEDGVLLVDFEGDPMRTPDERRSLSSPLRDVAAFLRSIDHVARSGARRAAARDPAARRTDRAGASDPDGSLDGWIASARAAFLDGYRTGSDDPRWSPPEALLRAFEVEKELGEFVYAARYLPDWLYAPAGGMRSLLGA